MTRWCWTLLLAALPLTGCVGPPTGEADTMSDVTQLTTGFTRAGPAAFSPDMRWLLFQAIPPNESQYQIFVAPVRAEGDRIAGLGTPIRLTRAGSRNSNPCFTPDGQSIVFASGSVDKVVEESPTSQPMRGGLIWSFPRGIEIVRVDNWQNAIAMPEPGKGVDVPLSPLTHFGAYTSECSLSADGNYIVFASSRDPSGDVDIYAMRSDGSKVVQITHTPGYDGGPTFSPDGRRLLFRSDRTGSGALQLQSLDLDYDRQGALISTRNPLTLTDDTTTHVAPVWHPTGQYLMYASNLLGNDNFELHLMRRSGKQDCRITFSDGFDGFPSFSPDSKYMLWSSKRTADGTVQLFVARFRVPPYVMRQTQEE